jgi:hypothetical protein
VRHIFFNGLGVTEGDKVTKLTEFFLGRPLNTYTLRSRARTLGSRIYIGFFKTLSLRHLCHSVGWSCTVTRQQPRVAIRHSRRSATPRPATPSAVLARVSRGGGAHPPSGGRFRSHDLPDRPVASLTRWNPLAGTNFTCRRSASANSRNAAAILTPSATRSSISSAKASAAHAGTRRSPVSHRSTARHPTVRPSVWRICAIVPGNDLLSHGMSQNRAHLIVPSAQSIKRRPGHRFFRGLWRQRSNIIWRVTGSGVGSLDMAGDYGQPPRSARRLWPPTGCPRSESGRRYRNDRCCVNRQTVGIVLVPNNNIKLCPVSLTNDCRIRDIM